MALHTKWRSRLLGGALCAATGSLLMVVHALLTGLGCSLMTSLVWSLGLALSAYCVTRPWVLAYSSGSRMLTFERMFEQLYRIAREAQVKPQRSTAILLQLLGDLFDPTEVALVDTSIHKIRVTQDGLTMLIPLPTLLDGNACAQRSAVVRHAPGSGRVFTPDDVRLTRRIMEQLQQAAHFDQAVEQGRSEERLRLAQDLHDDIGARLLTLMYQAQSTEMEEYVRHTLQDLKTLTRGLASANHRLSHAAGEWKADLTHRLNAARIELNWTLSFDEDLALSVVHWSALTRILRELVSNAIAHAQAQALDIHFSLKNRQLELTVTDNGSGTNPTAWSHGLGLGGVNKRVRQLGGQVDWQEAQPCGICCRVFIRNLSAPT
jgi:signal transduction histidine kinase